MNNQYKPEEMPALIPYLIVRDADESFNFYKDAFGFEEIKSMKGEDGRRQHVEVRLGDAVMMFGPEETECGRKTELVPSASITVYIYCENVDELYKNAVAHGAESLNAPEDGFWGDRFCKIKDPNGHHFMFATHTGKEVQCHKAENKENKTGGCKRKKD